MKKVIIEIEVSDDIQVRRENLTSVINWSASTLDFVVIDNCIPDVHIVKIEARKWIKAFTSFQKPAKRNNNLRPIFVIDKVSLDRYHSVGTQDELIIKDGDTFIYVNKSLTNAKDGSITNSGKGEWFMAASLDIIVQRYFSDDDIDIFNDVDICHNCGKIAHKQVECECDDLPF